MRNFRTSSETGSLASLSACGVLMRSEWISDGLDYSKTWCVNAASAHFYRVLQEKNCQTTNEIIFKELKHHLPVLERWTEILVIVEAMPFTLIFVKKKEGSFYLKPHTWIIDKSM